MGKIAVIHCDSSTSEITGAGVEAAVDCIVARQLRLQKRDCLELFDFTPNELEGRMLDCSLYAKLDTCLHAESKTNKKRFFAPLAYHQTLLRISRYLWLKNCISRFLVETGATELVLGSSNDADLASACQAVCLTLCIPLEVRDGPAVSPSNIIHRLGPYGLPKHADPLPLAVIRNTLIQLTQNSGSVLCEPELESNTALRLKSLRIHNQVSLLNTVARTVRTLWTKTTPELLTPIAHTAIGEPLHALEWQAQFLPDELLVIASALNFFFNHFPTAKLNKLARNIVGYLQAASPSMLVLSHDRADIYRMLAYCAHQCDIPVAYFPHGIIWEDYSGSKTDSLFAPDGMLAWTSESKENFQSQGWPALLARFPRYQREAIPYKPFSLDKPSAPRLLYLLPEWVCATRAGREDCLIHDLIQVIDAATEIGLPFQNLHVKFHSGPPSHLKVKLASLERIEKFFGWRLNILPYDTDTFSIIGNYDLILTSLTSGIFEAILGGVPLVIVGLGYERIGALAKHHIPHANSTKLLVDCLSSYDNADVSRTYRSMVKSLQSTATIDNCHTEIVRDWHTRG